MSVNFGLRQEGSTIWVSSNVYSTNNSWSGNPYTGPLVSGIPGGSNFHFSFKVNGYLLMNKTTLMLVKIKKNERGISREETQK